MDTITYKPRAAPNPRHHSLSPQVHLLGSVTRKVKEKVRMKLKVLSLYSSSPTAFSQHCREGPVTPGSGSCPPAHPVLVGQEIPRCGSDCDLTHGHGGGFDRKGEPFGRDSSEG